MSRVGLVEFIVDSNSRHGMKGGGHDIETTRLYLPHPTLIHYITCIKLNPKTGE